MSVGCGQRVLVVEDGWLIADQIKSMLEDENLVVAGPASSVREALAVLERTAVACAVLDVNLKGERSMPIADALTRRGVPFVFITGYTAKELPDYLASRPILHKPLSQKQLRMVLTQLLGAETVQS